VPALASPVMQLRTPLAFRSLRLAGRRLEPGVDARADPGR
jgi:hypothetical protein